MNSFFQKNSNFALKSTITILIMKAFVNDTEVRTYYGAKVKSVVLAYCRANNLSLKLDDVEIRDAYGNIVGLDGSLRANSKLYFKI